MSSSVYCKDGLHFDYCQLFPKPQALEYFNRLENEIVYFSGDLAKVKIYGKSYSIPRQHVAFGDDHLQYTFSGLTVKANPWTPLLLEIKDAVENKCGETFNFLLINKYRSGNDCIGFHRDDETDLVPSSSIASVSLGQERDFVFKREGFKPVTISLESGSLLQMLTPTNDSWCHGLPRRKNAPHVRLNLTFRRMKGHDSPPRGPITSVPQGTLPEKSLFVTSHGDQPIRWLDDNVMNQRVGTCSADTGINPRHSAFVSSVCFPTLDCTLPVSPASSLPAAAVSVFPKEISAANMKRHIVATPSIEKKVRFEDSASEAVDLHSTPSSGFSLENLPPHHVSLGGNKFIKVSEFSSSVRVHIRSYHFDGKLFHPTKYGVTMSALTFAQFMDDIYRVSEMNEMRVYNRELVVNCVPSAQGSTYEFQRIGIIPPGVRQMNITPVSLNFDQFEELKNKACPEIWKSITELQFGSIFKNAVLNLQSSSDGKKESISDDELTFVLADVVKGHLEKNIDLVFYCRECHLPPHLTPDNQLAHTCADYSRKDRWKFHFDEAVALLDPMTLAKSFLQESEPHMITKDFLTNLNVKVLLETVKAMY